MVNQERLALGTAALRSGKYPQATNSLRTTAGYCCLGVLTEVAIDNGAQVVVDQGNSVWYYDGGSSDLCPTVRDWYGFDRSDPLLSFFEDDHENSCISANDALHKTFPEIADALDATYGTEEGQDNAAA